MLIDSQLLRGMMLATPRCDIRAYLNTIHIKDKIIEVTNGNYLIRAPLDESQKKERLFSLIGNIPKNAVETELDFKSSFATHRNKNYKIIGASYISNVDGKYPDTNALIKDFTCASIETIRLSPEYISIPSRFFNCSAAKLDFGCPDTMCRITFWIKNNVEVEMYIMPMRIE